MTITQLKPERANIDFHDERIDLACAFRWAVKLNLHEAVANHFSLAVGDDGSKFLINPNQRHFSLIKASDLLLLDLNNPPTDDDPDAPDPTAWGLHSSVHQYCPQARCALHVHSVYATVLASLKDSIMQPIDQNTAMFYQRHVVDEDYGGLAFEEEGKRCATLLADPKVKTLVMGNHGVMVIGSSVADAFNRLFYFERAAETYIKALQTGQPLRVLSDQVAAKTADEIDQYPSLATRHLDSLKAILDSEGSNYRE